MKALRRADVFKPRPPPSIDVDLFDKHRLRSDPQSAITVVLPVNNQLFLRLAVMRHTEHHVLLPLVMAVSAGRDVVHG